LEERFLEELFDLGIGPFDLANNFFLKNGKPSFFLAPRGKLWRTLKGFFEPSDEVI